MKTERSVFLMCLIGALVTLNASGAVVARSSANASRSALSRLSIASTTPQSEQESTTNETDTVETPVQEEDAESVVVENKTTQFDTSLSNALSNNTDLAKNNLAEMIRAQRAALDAASNLSASATKSRKTSVQNSCDSGLRQCMTEKCGSNFLKCSSDTDTAFGDKMDSCRRNLNCTANEFRLFSAEIKSDRKTNQQLKTFNDILDCGQNYDACIVAQCGTTYAKCLGKTAGDKAISNCNSIARECSTQDNGLATRTMNVFATLRQSAEVQITKDEQKLYSLRDQMKSVCSRLGAMFDERSLDCVYTVNFHAGDDGTLFASKKVYAGDTFDCTPNWFGIDVTTFKENAYRETRAQTSASSAMLGSGVGMAVGALTSGAISNAVNRQNAQDAVNDATKEERQQQRDERKQERQEKRDERQKKT